MKRYLPIGVIAGILMLGGTAIGHGKHHPSADPAFGTAPACTFNPTPAPGADAEPFLWGACSDEQASLGGVTVTLYVVPN